MTSAPLRFALTIAAICGLSVAPAAAQEATSAPPAAVALPPLWKVADADTTIYLFGTIHALPKGVDWLQGPLATAVDSSEELVTELPEVDQVRLQSYVSSNAILPKGTTLRSILPLDERTRLEAALLKTGMELNALDAFEPWFAYFVLFRVELSQQGISPDDGVEAVLARRMVAAQKRPRSGLETIEYQLSLFDALPLPVQRKLLSGLTETGSSLRDDLDKIVAEWGKGNPDTLARLMNEDEDAPELIETLVTNRNRNWASWIRTRLDSPGTVFVAVGAGHLAGTGSVQDQLAVLGIQTARVQ